MVYDALRLENLAFLEEFRERKLKEFEQMEGYRSLITQFRRERSRYRDLR